MNSPFDPFRGPSSPIAWGEFDAAAFSAAGRARRSILLVIVAQWCPYSQRLLDRLSRDAASHDVIAEGYTPILVDADDAPALHRRYSGGGWPTIALLTAEGEPMWRGTQIDADRFAPFLRSWLGAGARGAGPGPDDAGRFVANPDPDPQPAAANVSPADAAQRILAAALDAFDAGDGMFRLEPSGGPRFPHLDVIDLLIAHARVDASAAEVARSALTRLLHDGLWDADGGGLRRYGASASQDDVHGEKLLVDNAALLSTLLSAAEVWPEASFQVEAERVWRWIEERLGGSHPWFAGSIRPRHAEVPDGWAVPALDASALVDANARTATALLSLPAGGAERALSLLDWLWEVAWSEEDGVGHRVRRGKVVAPGELADAAAVVEALVAAWDATKERRWLERATAVLDDALVRFRGDEGAFVDLPRGGDGPGRLGVPHYPLRANAVVAESARRAELATGEAKYGEASRGIMAALAGRASISGLFGAAYALAQARAEGGA